MQEQNDLQSMQGNQIEKLDNRKFSRLELAAQIVGSIFVLLNLSAAYMYLMLLGTYGGDSGSNTEETIFSMLLPSVIIIDIVFLYNIRKPRRMRSVLANTFDAFFWILAIALIILLLWIFGRG